MCSVTGSLAALGALFGGQVTDERIALYTERLSIYPEDLVAKACQNLSARATFFPSLAEILNEIVELATDMPAPETAWGLVVAEIRRVGMYQAPALAPEIADAVRALGGWRFLCSSVNATADRARFVDAYRLIRRQSIESVKSLQPSDARDLIASGSQPNDRRLKD